MPTLPDLHALAVDVDAVLHSHGVTVPAVDLLRALPGVLNPRATVPRMAAVPDCPDWCELPAGHAYTVRPDRRLERTHQSASFTMNGDSIEAAVRAEMYVNDDGTEVELTGPYVWLHGATGMLSAAETRSLAARLTQLAGRADSIGRE